MDLSRPHANFAEWVLKAGYGKDILEPFLPAELLETVNWQSLTLADGSYVDEKLKDFHSDLLFTVNTVNNDQISFYLLVEHKSHPDYHILQQLLAYQKEIYARQEHYVPVVPLVFYHGLEKWNIRQKFSEPPPSIAPFVLNFGYILVNLAEVDVSKLKISLTTAAILYTFKTIWTLSNEQTLTQYFSLIANLFLSVNDTRLLERILVYIYSVHNIVPASMKKAIEAGIPDKGEIAMSTAELLVREGETKGKIEGKIEKAIETARRMIAMGLAIELVTQVTDLTEEELRQHGVI